MSRKLTLLSGLSYCFAFPSVWFCVNKPHFQSSPDKGNRVPGIELAQQAGTVDLNSPVRTMEQRGYIRTGLTLSHKLEHSHFGLA
jgi:hypothetical protein